MILLVEDDRELGEGLREYLEREGFEVVWLTDPEEFGDVDRAAGFDVVILDLILRSTDGESFLAKLRERGIDVPVLILTAKTGIESKELCFALGADDYLTKPFDPRELVLRLRALARRRNSPERFMVGDVLVDIGGKVLKKGDRELKLSRTAWKLLELLAKNRGKVVNTEVILNYVWGDKPVGDDIVRAYIKELRKVLPRDSIENVRGIGYRLR